MKSEEIGYFPKTKIKIEFKTQGKITENNRPAITLNLKASKIAPRNVKSGEFLDYFHISR